jgi:hypothetical protein
LIFGLAACTAKPVAPGPNLKLGAAPSGPAVPWQGLEFQEVTSLAALPPAIRKVIGADQSGFEGIAEKGHPFNSTDVIVDETPHRRFLVAGHAGDVWLVALEQGGIGYYVSVAQISGGVAQKGWAVDCCATSLAEIVRQIATAPPEATFTPKP